MIDLRTKNNRILQVICKFRTVGGREQKCSLWSSLENNFQRSQRISVFGRLFSLNYLTFLRNSYHVPKRMRHIHCKRSIEESRSAVSVVRLKIERFEIQVAILRRKKP